MCFNSLAGAITVELIPSTAVGPMLVVVVTVLEYI